MVNCSQLLINGIGEASLPNPFTKAVKRTETLIDVFLLIDECVPILDGHKVVLNEFHLILERLLRVLKICLLINQGAHIFNI